MTVLKRKKTVGLGLIFIGVYILIDGFIPVNPKKYNKPDSEFSELTAYLINTPKYIERGGKTSSKFLRLELDSYSGAFFDNEGEFLDAMNWKNVMDDIKYHDTVTIKVLKYEFDKYYLNRNSLPLFKRFFNSSGRFNFYSLKFKGKEYVKDIYEAAESRRKRNIIYRVLIGGLIIFCGTYFFKGASNK